MEAPKEIYLQQKKRSGLIDGYYNTPIWEDTHDNIKYIRADLAELTWEDIQRLAVIMDEEECDWNVKVWEKQEVAEQVLHRFNEERNKQS